MQIAILGLSVMGKILCEKLLADGHEVVVWNRSKEELEQIRMEKAEFVVNQKLTIIHTIEEMRNFVRKPRVLWSMQDAGEPTETILQEINQLVEAGDIVIDGGNTNFRDTERHSGEFEKKSVKFLGIGIAGGIHSLENGCSLMVGGNQDAYQYVLSLLDSLAKPNGIHTYFGRGGAGHFLYMIHSGIEAGMLQAIAEGMAILSKSDYQVDMVESVNTFQSGSIISSFLLDMAMDSLSRDPSLSEYNGVVAQSSEARTLVDQAKSINTPTPAIEHSLQFRDSSQYDKLIQDTFVAKMVQAMLEEYSEEV